MSDGTRGDVTGGTQATHEISAAHPWRLKLGLEIKLNVRQVPDEVTVNVVPSPEYPPNNVDPVSGPS